MEIDESVEQMIKTFSKINTDVPARTRKRLADIEHIDYMVKAKMEEIQKTKVQFMANYEKMSSEQKTKAFNILIEEMQQLSEFSDKKIEIAKSLKQDMVDVHAKFCAAEKKFIENIHLSPVKDHLAKAPKAVELLTETNHSKSNRKKKMSEEEEDVAPPPLTEEKKRGRKKKDVQETTQEEEHEDTKQYCWCQLEKQDSMVFCENAQCKYEWFHFTCIGMVTAPVGDWYCTTQCRQQAAEARKEENAPTAKMPGRKAGMKRKK